MKTNKHTCSSCGETKTTYRCDRCDKPILSDECAKLWINDAIFYDQKGNQHREQFAFCRGCAAWFAREMHCDASFFLENTASNQDDE